MTYFASFYWPIPGPITYCADPDGPVTFALFCFFFICTLFGTLFWTKEASRLGCFKTRKRNRKAEITTLHQKLTLKIVNNYKNLNLSVQIVLFRPFSKTQERRTSSFVQNLLTGQLTTAKPFSNFYTNF